MEWHRRKHLNNESSAKPEVTGKLCSSQPFSGLVSELVLKLILLNIWVILAGMEIKPHNSSVFRKTGNLDHPNDPCFYSTNGGAGKCTLLM